MSTSAELLVVIIAVAAGGAGGASLRYLVEMWAVSRWGQSWPWGTLAVNVAGSLVLGALVGSVLAADLPRWATLFLATGFCGALTTFSSFALQVVDLSVTVTSPDEAAGRFSLRGIAYAATSMGAGLLAALVIPVAMARFGL